MNENLVKAVMAAYFKQKNVVAHPTGKGEKGADFYIDGAAVEVKGVGLSYGRLLEQLVIYAYREKEVHLALPVAALTAEGLIQLYLLDGIMRELRGKSLKLYLVDEQSEWFYVKEFPGMIYLVPHGISHFKTIASFAQLVDRPLGLKGNVPETEARRIAQSVARAIQKADIAVRQLLIEAIREHPYAIVHKSTVKDSA